jgi:hypothetical protein
MRNNQSQLSAAFDIQYDPKHCCINFSHRIRFVKIIAHLMQEFAEGSFDALARGYSLHSQH